MKYLGVDLPELEEGFSWWTNDKGNIGIVTKYSIKCWWSFVWVPYHVIPPGWNCVVVKQYYYEKSWLGLVAYTDIDQMVEECYKQYKDFVHRLDNQGRPLKEYGRLLG